MGIIRARARDLSGVFLRFPLQIQATRPYNSHVPIMARRAFALMPFVTHSSLAAAHDRTSFMPTVVLF